MKDELKELIDNSSPLMEMFKDKCPGTFRHCQNVADLCESIASELDVDAESLVVAAKLHDLGKSNNPLYFSENQSDETNPHDELDPPVSFQYISRHIADTCLKLIQIPEISRKVINIVSEHHGDSIVGGIYNKAKKLYNGNTVPDHYRYKNRKPTSVESAILMCCDVCESATRSLHNNGKLDDIKLTIDDLVNTLVDDEQLDILTIGHLRVIRKVMYKEIKSTFHKRVDYKVDDTDE